MLNAQPATARFPFIVTMAAVLAMAGLALAADDDAVDAATDVKVGGLQLHIPTTWKQEEVKSRLRLAQFRIPAAEGDKEEAELAVFSFGAGGGVEANIRRWVEQFQPEGRKATVSVGKAELGQYVVADITGTYKKPVGPPVAGKTEDAPGSRVLAVILAVPEKGNFFFKMSGLDKTVAAQAAALRKSFGGDPQGEKELKLDE